MSRARANRVAKLEAASTVATRPYPGALIVPPRDRTPEDNADFEVKFLAQQTKLVAEARSERRKETDEC
jgi:hypothetical protein